MYRVPATQVVGRLVCIANPGDRSMLQERVAYCAIWSRVLLWAVDVSKNWRIVFRFQDANAYVVDYGDYH